MERLSGLLRGCVAVEISAAEPERFLNLCAEHGLTFWDAVPLDKCRLRLTIMKRDRDRCGALAERAQCEAVFGRARGLPMLAATLLRRGALLLGLLCFAAAMLWSSLHIWEIEVTGNETVETWRILNALDSIGVGVGSFWPSFTSDNIRSQALVLLPELSWLTVNVKGSRAEVIVRERTAAPELLDESAPVKVVAGKPGLITEIRVLRGERLALPGQTAAAGDEIISGLVPSSFAPPRLLHAQGEIMARTWYTLTAKTSLQRVAHTELLSEKRCFSIVLGRKRINFYKSSGILTPSCDKITVEHALRWKGVFSLPVSLVETRVLTYQTETVSVDKQTQLEKLSSLLQDHLLAQIGESGSVTEQHMSFSESAAVLCATLHAECLEQIGVEVPMTEEEMAPGPADPSTAAGGSLQ